MWGSIQFSGRLENPSRRIIGYILYCIQNLINTRSKSTCQIESWAEIIILRHESLIRQFTNGPCRPVYVTSVNDTCIFVHAYKDASVSAVPWSSHCTFFHHFGAIVEFAAVSTEPTIYALYLFTKAMFEPFQATTPIPHPRIKI